MTQARLIVYRDGVRAFAIEKTFEPGELAKKIKTYEQAGYTCEVSTGSLIDTPHG